MAGFIRNFSLFLIAVFNEKQFFKNPPSEETDTIFSLAYYRAEVLSMQNPKRCFIETFYFANQLIKTNLSKSPIATALFVRFSIFFFWTGISLKISSRIIAITKKYIKRENTYTYLRYRFLKKMHDYHEGIIEGDKDQATIISTAFEKGAFWEAVTYVLFSGFCAADAGKRDICQQMAEGLMKVSESFENTHARIQYFRYLSYVAIKFRELHSSVELLTKAINIPESVEYEASVSVIYSNLSILFTMTGEQHHAKEALAWVEKNEHKIRMSMPFYSTYLMAKVRYEFMMTKGGPGTLKHSPDTLKRSLRELMKTANKFRGILPEAMLLRAQVDHLLGNRKQAIKTLKKALHVAENSGAHLELARINFELGKCLSDPKGKHQQLYGNPASYYLENSQRMFEEMGLERDLEEYLRFKGTAISS